MTNYFKRLYHWMGTRVHASYAEPILALLFFLEAIFFLPTDPMLILYCIERPERGIRFATVATIASVFGGIAGYFIGSFLWDTMGQQIINNRIINYVITPQLFTYLSDQYRKYEWWAVLIAGFTPVPYKAATLAAGFCKLSLPPFIFASIVARGARFYLLAITIKLLGDRLKNSIDRYFNIILALTFIIVAATYWWLS